MLAEGPNFWAVLERLTAGELEARAAQLVEAAMEGDDAVQSALSSTPGPATEHRRPVTSARAAPRAFLDRIAVCGFRGIGPECALELTPGPGLTLVVGRNGSGKSSFVEGLEMLLTGDSTRWTGKKPVRQWRSGWRNLHGSDEGVSVCARLTVEGSKEPVTVQRRWAARADLGASALSVRRGTHLLEGALDELGWGEALAASRPFLSYNDISSAWDRGPSKLFDALMGMLGMEDVRAALDRLATVRKAMEKRRKAAQAQTKALAEALSRSADPRASRAASALAGRRPDLAAVDAVLGGDDGEDAEDELVLLRRQASISLPDETRVIAVIEALEGALEQLERASHARDAHVLQTAELLEHAVAWHEQVGAEVCPVCGTEGVLSEAWRERAAAEAAALKQAAQGMHRARAALRDATLAAESLTREVRTPPGEGPLADAARLATQAWADAPDEPLALSRHLARQWTELERAFGELKRDASQRLEALHADWRPLRRQLEDWREEQRALQAESEDRDAVRAAEVWLKDVDQELRAEAFAPIAERARHTWSQLRAQSNVDIADITLVGTSTHRKVSLDVTVDGTEGAALGVMSQGELHALALSLFLPRLLRADSPFGFVLIDDPVQAMDPAKVDGLAAVLRDAARTHQVVVFTHDPRLPAAVRRLGIGATILEVRRNPTSHVHVRIGQDPVQQHISDAMHLLDQQRSGLSDEVVRHVVPGLCRAAVEAALTRRIWREQLAAGHSHATISEAIAATTGVHELATVAFFGNRVRGADLYARLKRLGPGAVEGFIALKRHAHCPLEDDVDVLRFIQDSRELARWVLK